MRPKDLLSVVLLHSMNAHRRVAGTAYAENAQHLIHSVGRGKRDLHDGMTLHLGQLRTTSHRSTALFSPVITMRPVCIYNVMIGSRHETQMTGYESHRPIFISRHATATICQSLVVILRSWIHHSSLTSSTPLPARED